MQGIYRRRQESSIYSYWFLVPAISVFLVFFIVPMLISFYFSMTIWNFETAKFCGLDNYRMFFTEYSLSIGIKNTFLYAFLTSGLKVLLAFLIAIYLTSAIKTRDILRSIVFFPNLVSAVAVGIAFKAMMHPTKGIINQFIGTVGLNPINWLGDKNIALFSVIMTDVWKGLSIATVIYVAGISSIDTSYYEASNIDGASKLQQLMYVTVPLTASSRNTIIILSFIGGLRSFELIWSMTGGGPGFATDVLSSVIYKQYAQGYYGLSTAGNVIMLIMTALLAFPLQHFLNRSEGATR